MPGVQKKPEPGPGKRKAVRKTSIFVSFNICKRTSNQAHKSRIKNQAFRPANTTMVNNKINTLISLSSLNGEDTDIQAKIDSLISSESVLVISKTFCPFSIDVKDLLTETIGVRITALELDQMTLGSKVQTYIKTKYEHTTVPAVFICGEFIGGCDTLKAKYFKGELDELLKDLKMEPVALDADKLENAKLVSAPRGSAIHPLFWFPNVINDHVVRVTGCQVFVLSVLSAVYYEDEIGSYLAVFLLIDFIARFVVGSSMSVLGMIATVITASFVPSFKPGPPKQFAALCGVCFSAVAVACYFTGHEVWGAVVVAMLAGASGLEGFVGFCLGCLFYSWGIQFGLIPDYVYRIYTSSRQEIVDSWNYLNVETKNAVAPEPVFVDSKNPIALKYKKKSDDWTLQDFHLVRNMQVTYFAMPLSLSGLASALKIGANNWGATSFPGIALSTEKEFLESRYWEVVSIISATVFVLMTILYGIRLIKHPAKCKTEWDCPLRSPSFGTWTITMMLLAFLFYDAIDDDDYILSISRGFFYFAISLHIILTVMKTAEWIGFRLELEHVHASWMIFPVGLGVAVSCYPVFAGDYNDFLSDDLILANAMYSVAYLMWITLFVITFFKAVTTHNSDDRVRHALFIWLAAPGVIGFSDYILCTAASATIDNDFGQCQINFIQHYALGLFFFAVFIWASMPHINFFGRDKFSMNYWVECFALDMLAATSVAFHLITEGNTKVGFMYTFIVIAGIANALAFLHTLASVIRRRAVFTPTVKWGPLSFMKLTHEAFRGALPRLVSNLKAMNVNDMDSIKYFAALYAQFCIVHEEHANAEDKVIFKVYNDYFEDHAKTWNDDHANDHKKMDEWHIVVNTALSSSASNQEKSEAIKRLKTELPSFFAHFEEHMLGEENDLQPIARKHISLELQKQISRKCFELAPASRLEVMIPFVVNNTPREQQRIRYLKALCWAMPERAQQIGSIVYRNVDAVMWERLRVELPEIIPRGAKNWRRYY